LPLSLLPYDGIDLKRNHPYYEDSRASIGTSSLGKILQCGKPWDDRWLYVDDGGDSGREE
jgi:hypothetical protein